MQLYSILELFHLGLFSVWTTLVGSHLGRERKLSIATNPTFQLLEQQLVNISGFELGREGKWLRNRQK